jgi:5-methylcytosine-specific restriction endonuclease McrA
MSRCYSWTGSCISQTTEYPRPTRKLTRVTSLDAPVLVLNRYWQPVNTCTARRAVTLLFLDHAQVVHRDVEDNYHTFDAEQWMKESTRSGIQDSRRMRTVSSAFVVPEIIVLSHYDRLPRKAVKFTRHNVFLRDRYVCQYCGKHFEAKDLNLDHVIPRDKGGKTSWENVVTSCIRCNTKKANKYPHEARMIPLVVPRAPRWRPFHAALQMQDMRPSWREFLASGEHAVEMSS